MNAIKVGTRFCTKLVNNNVNSNVSFKFSGVGFAASKPSSITKSLGKEMKTSKSVVIMKDYLNNKNNVFFTQKREMATFNFRLDEYDPRDKNKIPLNHDISESQFGPDAFEGYDARVALAQFVAWFGFIAAIGYVIYLIVPSDMNQEVSIIIFFTNNF